MIKKIVFLSSYDPHSTSSWSGTPKFMLDALSKQGINVVSLGPVNSYVLFFLKIYKFFIKKFFSKDYDYSHSTLLSYEYGLIFKYKLKKHFDADFIIAPAGSTQIAMLRTNIPIYYISDTTYAQIEEYYSNFTNLIPRCSSSGNKIENLALNRASLVSFPSSWASRFAVEYYGISSEKIKTILWGANLLSNPNIKYKDNSNKSDFNCLFLGVDWNRKGGETALSAVRIVREAGINAELIICGCVPECKDLPEWVKITGRLNKDIQSEYKLFCDLLTSADVLILPTKAECYGMVFCEAAAYGIPVIATDTGGISSIVDQRTGFLIQSHSDAKSFSDALLQLLSDPVLFKNMSSQARKKYEEKLNWDSWAICTLENMSEYLQRK